MSQNPIQIALRAPTGALGEIELTHAEMAARHGTSEQVVDKWLGNTRVVTTVRPIYELGLRAASTSLERAGVPAGELSYLLVSGVNSLRIQNDLAADRAVAFDHAGGCSSLLEMAFRARSLLAEDPQANHVLCMAAFKIESPPWSAEINRLRSWGPMTESAMRDVFCDGAGAFLMTREAGPLTLLGAGYATLGHHWDLIKRFEAGNAPSAMQVMHDAINVFRTAYERCLKFAGITKGDIRWALFLLEGPHMAYSNARVLGIPREKVVLMRNPVMHVGGVDPAIILEDFLEAGVGRPGDVAVLVLRRIGGVAIAAVRVS